MNTDSCRIDQRFGVNPQVYAPLAGHPGEDEHCGYGSIIHADEDMHIYKILTVDRPSNDGSGFTGVFGIVDNGVECYELLYGHCNPLVSEGQTVKKGDRIGWEANHGLVFENGVQITLAMQKAGDQRGSHRHVQKRPVYKSLKVSTPCLSAYNDLSGTYRDAEGFYYPVWHYNNGFHGCIDPSLPLFARDLTIASEGYDVWVLQRLLVNKGFGSFSPTGFFGPATQAAVLKFQNANNIPGGTGSNVGPKTRAILNALLLTY